MVGDFIPRNECRVWAFLLEVVADDRERGIGISGYGCADRGACETSVNDLQTEWHSLAFAG